MSEQQTTRARGAHDAAPDRPPDRRRAAGDGHDPGSDRGRIGRTDVAAVFTAVLDAVAGIARDVADTAGPAIHDAMVKAGPGVREGAARAADVAARAADAAGPVATKVAGATGDVGHKLAQRSRGLAVRPALDEPPRRTARPGTTAPTTTRGWRRRVPAGPRPSDAAAAEDAGRTRLTAIDRS